MTPDGMTSLGAGLAALVPALENGRRRNPVIRTRRTEARAPIPRKDRVAVYTRDCFRCVWCGSDEQLTLDHIIPWSAGGSDEFDNLRTLCWACNEKRSNFSTEADDACRSLPLTYYCVECDATDTDMPLEHPSIGPAFCWWCQHKALGFVGRWFAENNAYWDYDLNWHREKSTVHQEAAHG